MSSLTLCCAEQAHHHVSPAAAAAAAEPARAAGCMGGRGGRRSHRCRRRRGQRWAGAGGSQPGGDPVGRGRPPPAQLRPLGALRRPGLSRFPWYMYSGSTHLARDLTLCARPPTPLFPALCMQGCGFLSRLNRAGRLLAIVALNHSVCRNARLIVMVSADQTPSGCGYRADHEDVQ